MVRSNDNIFLKNFGKMHKFEVSNFKSRVSVSEFLMKSQSQSRSRLEILNRSRSRSRRLRSRLHHWWSRDNHNAERYNLLGFRVLVQLQPTSRTVEKKPLTACQH